MMRTSPGRILGIAGAAVFLLASSAAAQDSKRPTPVNPLRVDQAIRKGVSFLRTAPSPPGGSGLYNSDELILLALIHAGLSESDPRVKELLGRILSAPLERTYKVALQAMALEELHRVKYQGRIFLCAQFLVENQATNGQWSYGTPVKLVPPPSDVATRSVPKRKAGVRRFRRPAKVERVKPKVRRKLAVRRARPYPKPGEDGTSGDNSNSQYAALGLRACHDAGIVFSRDVVTRAVEWWHRSQAGQEEADDNAPKKKRRPVATSPSGMFRAEPHGWGYSSSEIEVTGSMTAGAVGALVIYDYILGKDWMRNPRIASGMSWLEKHFTVARNPGAPDDSPWHCYYLYGLERACVLFDTPTLGRHDWYTSGALFLLDAQNGDGSWGTGEGDDDSTWDTCFAILFLKRATRPLKDVSSVDRFHAGPSR